MSANGRCPACDSDSVVELAGVGPVPVLCGSLWDSRVRAEKTPTAELCLTSCGRCGHVWNRSFEPALVEYDADYDNALDFSETFTDYAERLGRRLVEDHCLHGKRVVEIGSGKGEFLRLLCSLGGNRGVGFDPTYVGLDVEGDVTFVRDFFTPESAPGDVDFLCCRHVLEHLADPCRFLQDIREAVNHAAVPMYFEVPNAEFNFNESGPWDLIYPHVAYFNQRSLSALLERAGFRVLRIELGFDGQFLGAVVVPVSDLDANGEPRLRSVHALGGEWFRAALTRQLAGTDSWRHRLESLAAAGPVALWGAGSKGVTFLALVDVARAIGTVVDANPRKWGRFLPATGHEVVAPSEVAVRSVRAVLVMNPAYAAEIRRDIAAMGADAEVVLV